MDAPSIECTFSRVLEPFTRKRKPAPTERASMLTLWSSLVRRAVTRRIVFVAQEAQGAAHLLLAKSANPTSSTSSSSFGSRHHERLVVLVQFLRFATLRKVIDGILLDRSGRLLTAAERSHVARSMLHAAAEVCHVLPTEDRRMVGQRRGLPWGSLEDVMDSSDEDRDDGAPRPVDVVFRCVGEVLAAQWSLVSPSPVDAPFSQVGCFAEEVKLMLLRTLKYKDPDSTGTMLALTLLLLRYVLQWHRAHPPPPPMAAAPLPLPEVPDAMMRDPSVRDLYDMLDRYAATYVGKSDGAFLSQWSTGLHMLPAVRAMHSALLVYAMHLGMYRPSIPTVNRTRAHQGTAFSEQAQSMSRDPLAFSSSPFEKSARRCTLEVIMECLEWSLANSGPACTSMYLHRYPSRYGELSGHFRSATEMRVVGEASTCSDEITHRCELLCEEMQGRWELSLQAVTGDIPSYPHVAAGLPPGMTTHGPFAIRYATRKKIAAFLNDVCPDRYPVRELLVLPQECPEVEALLAEREWIALAQTEVLRGIRLEVHHRLEWERVEKHERDALVDASQAHAMTTFVAHQQSMVVQEAAVRGCMILDAEEASHRLDVHRHWLLTSVALEGKRVVHKVRAKVQERTVCDVSVAWGIVCNLESAKRIAIQHHYELALRTALFYSETCQRHAVRWHAERDNATLLREHLAVQCAVGAAGVREQEVAERSLVVRFGMSLMSRVLMRGNRCEVNGTHPTSDRHAIGSVAASFVHKVLNPQLLARCQCTLAPGDAGGVAGNDLTGVALVDVVRWYDDALQSVRRVEKDASERRVAVEAAWLQEHTEVVSPAFVAHQRAAVVLEEAASRRLVEWDCRVAALTNDETWHRTQRMADAMDAAASDLVDTSTYEALALYTNATRRVVALLRDGEPRRRDAIAVAESNAWHELSSRRRGDVRQRWQRHQVSASRSLGQEQGVTPRLIEENAVLAPFRPSRPTSAICEYIPTLGDEEELDRKSRSTSSIALREAKSPSRSSSAGLTTLLGTLSSDSRVLSRPHSNIDDMISSIAFIMELGTPWGSVEGSSRRTHTPHRQQLVLSPTSSVGASPRTQRHQQHSQSVVVVEVPKRPTSGKPAVYRTVPRHAYQAVEFL